MTFTRNVLVRRSRGGRLRELRSSAPRGLYRYTDANVSSGTEVPGRLFTHIFASRNPFQNRRHRFSVAVVDVCAGAGRRLFVCALLWPASFQRSSQESLSK